MDKTRTHLPLLSVLFLFYLLSSHNTWAESSNSLKGVLFYPPFCDQCEAVIDDFLMPLSMEQSDRLQLFPVDITEPPGDDIFARIAEQFRVEPGTWNRPYLLIGEKLLQGENEITSGLPQLLDTLDHSSFSRWPDLPGLSALINGESPEAGDTASLEEDRSAVILAWGVMVVMLLSLVFTAKRLLRYWRDLLSANQLRSWSLPLFALIGLAIGIYLSYVTLNNDQIMCGPIGDCMAVQSSPHARLFGIPMAVWGVVYYLGILLLWSSQRLLDGGLSRLGLLGLAGFSLFGVLFSIYLTSLELFVIHAVCLWCLTSAVLASLILITVILKTCGENACTRSAPQG